MTPTQYRVSNFTPEELKDIYKSNGYSVYAYSEHNEYHDLRHQAAARHPIWCRMTATSA